MKKIYMVWPTVFAITYCMTYYCICHLQQRKSLDNKEQTIYSKKHFILCVCVNNTTWLMTDYEVGTFKKSVFYEMVPLTLWFVWDVICSSWKNIKRHIVLYINSALAIYLTCKLTIGIYRVAKIFQYLKLELKYLFSFYFRLKDYHMSSWAYELEIFTFIFWMEII